MNRRGLAIFGLTAAFCASAQSPNLQKAEALQELQTAYCPNIHQLEVAPAQKFFLEGTIGKRHVRMYLDRGGSGVVGLFFEIANWHITELGGTWTNGQIDASDEGENHPATGHLSASLVKNRLTGNWIGKDSSNAEIVDLATIPEPSCNGKEPWKPFDDPGSPVAFSYPLSWHVEQSGATITLTCPNPSEIAYDQHITIYAGTGEPDRPPDEPTELLKCGDTWRYGGEAFCDCHKPDSLSCGTAKVSRRNSATILDVSDREWRIYCHDGGYVGQGYGEDRIVLLPHSWVEIMAPGKSSELINRLIDSVKERGQHQSK